MTRDELNERYSLHPLGHAMKACETATTWQTLHIYFITAKATIFLLRYQNELTQEDEDSLLAMLDEITDVRLMSVETKH